MFREVWCYREASVLQPNRTCFGALADLMDLGHITFQGPPIDDREVLARLPEDLAGLLDQLNGFIQFGGGFHVRGACSEPAWHSLREAWLSESAVHELYSGVRDSDIPFGQDCLGDQFLLRDGIVRHLSAETGEVETLGLSLMQFIERIQVDPMEVLGLQPLQKFLQSGGQLEPGRLIHAYPPFCTEEAANGVSLRDVPALELLEVHAQLARQVAGLPGGRAD